MKAYSKKSTAEGAQLVVDDNLKLQSSLSALGPRSIASKQSQKNLDHSQISQLYRPESDKQAFVTGLLEDQRQPHQMAQDRMEKYVDGIEDQFQNVLTRHERDFVNAYKGHMVKVQKELVFLKKKANDTAGKILNDDSITKLQGQIGWFKNEAIKLDAILEGQKREMQKMKSRELNINEDRKFLKDQIKDAMKHNKLLQVAIKKTNEQNVSISKFLEANHVKQPKQKRGSPSRGDPHELLSPTTIINKTMSQFQEPFITQQRFGKEEQQQQQAQADILLDPENALRYSMKQKNYLPQEILSQDSKDFRVKEFVIDLFDRGYSKTQIELKILKFFKMYDISRDERIKDLQKKLERSKTNNARMKNTQAVDYSEKSEIENLFLDCVDETKKDILKKKTLQNASFKFQNNAIQEASINEQVAILENVVLNKDTLVSVFEEMFGSGGFVGTTINNLEHQIKNKKYSLISQGGVGGGDNSISFFSNATTKDNQSEEMERLHMIMNAPIESLINNMSHYSTSNTRLGLRKYSRKERSLMNQRAQTAVGGANLNHSYYQDQTSINKELKLSKLRAATSHSNARESQKSRQVQLDKKDSSKDRSFTVRNGKLIINNMNNNV